MPDPIDSTNAVPDDLPMRPSPARIDTGAEKPPKPGSDEAKNEERKTKPSRNRGVTDL